MKKRLFCAILAAAFLVPTAALAQTPEMMHQEQISILLYDGLSSAVADLNVNGTSAKYTLSAIGSSSITKISATLQIEKRNSNGSYSSYGSSWRESSSRSSLSASGTRTVDSSGTYRLKVTLDLYEGNRVLPPITIYS